MSSEILVVGGAGYIGSHVAKALQKDGRKVTVFDNLSTGNLGAVKFGEFIEGDLCCEQTLEQIFSEKKFDGVLHFAGSIKVPESVENPEKYYQNNTQNSLNLIRACKKYGVKNFIFSSTAAIYGELPKGYADESFPKNPINPYGRSKLVTEWMLEDFASAYKNFNYVAIRYFNVCGADPELEIGQAFPEPFHLINIACEAATGKREKMAIYGEDYPTEDGTCIRDYIHVSDLADAHVLALKYLEKSGESLAVNCGYGHGYSVKQIIESVKSVTKVDFKVDKAKRRDGDPAVLIAKSDLIRQKFGWEPRLDNLDKIIETAFNWEQGQTIREWRHEKNNS